MNKPRSIARAAALAPVGASVQADQGAARAAVGTWTYDPLTPRHTARRQFDRCATGPATATRRWTAGSGRAATARWPPDR
jgi:hypothetical protein